jgi:hypothetical protein
MDHGAVTRDGQDVTWVTSHGASAAWQYAMSVQAARDDMEEDWRVCVESCAMALRAILLCRRLARGLDGPPDDMEFQYALATSTEPAASTLRNLPSSTDVDEHQARTAMASVEQHDAALRAELPFEVPITRTPAGARQAMRISATLVQWRRDRSLPEARWRQDGL